MNFSMINNPDTMDQTIKKYPTATRVKNVTANQRPTFKWWRSQSELVKCTRILQKWQQSYKKCSHSKFFEQSHKPIQNKISHPTLDVDIFI